MNALEAYYERLDKSNYDGSHRDKINDELKVVIDELLKVGDRESALLAEIDRQAFMFSKSFANEVDETGKKRIKGISWMMSGTATNKETGEEMPVVWPDISRYTEKEFYYLEKRYKATKNLFAKTEYGQILYFEGGEKKYRHHDFQRQLGNELFELSKHYLSDKKESDTTRFSELHFYDTILGAFVIAQKSKLEPELTKIIEYIFVVHQKWPLDLKTSLRILLDITNLITEYFIEFESRIDIKLVLEKNLKGINEQEKTYIWGAVYINDASEELDKKAGFRYFNWLENKGKLYEKLADEAEQQKNPAAITFVEKALRIYKELKDTKSIHRLEKRYVEVRGTHQLGEIKHELPDEYTKQVTENIQRIINDNDEIGLLEHFVLCPMYSSLNSIKNNAAESIKNSGFTQFFPTSIIDKFGNTIEMFVTEDEKKELAFWQSYGFSFQIGTQWLVYFFVEAFKAGKLSYESIIKYFEKSWYNGIIKRSYNGVQVEIKPIDILKPGLETFFQKLNTWKNNAQSMPIMTVVTDSLVLKIEALLRYMCEKIKISTFKPTRSKDANKHHIVMEKTIDEILASLEDKEEKRTGFSEDDRVFIKYILSEKAGLNLRNKVAHGLMDINEYGFEHPVLLFTIIMRLSKYSSN